MSVHMNSPKLPNLGLVCITTSEAVRYRTLTRKRLLQFGITEQQHMLRELYADNLARLNRALDFCVAHDLRLYRMTSALFPFADDPLGADLLEELGDAVADTGQRALIYGVGKPRSGERPARGGRVGV